MNIDPGYELLFAGLVMLITRHFYKRYLERHQNSEIDDRVRLFTMLWGGVMCVIAGMTRLLLLITR